MEIEETEINVEHEQAEHDHGHIVELKLRVSVATHYENGPSSVGVFDVVFEHRGQSGPLHWNKVVDQGDSDWFGPTHCAVVLQASEYVEENYGEEVDTKQIQHPS